MSVAAPIGGARGVIRSWSMESRIRLLKLCWAINWPARMVMVTLTYPGSEELELLPTCGADSKRDLDSWRKRLGRVYGLSALLGLWKQEYQERGAPHFHLWLGIPDGVSFEDFARTITDAWVGVVGSHGADHLMHGVTVTRWLGNPGRYTAAYTRKSSKKEYQHEVPEGWTDPGRFWGVWGLKPEAESIAVPVEKFLYVRRAMRGYQKARGRHTTTRGMSGGFAITDGPATALLARMVDG